MQKMKNSIPTLLTTIVSVLLVSCSQSYITSGHVRPSSTYGYTQKEVSILETKLKNTKFPKKDGYVESLLKNESGVGMMTSIADLLPNDEGILTTYTLTHSLNSDFTLLVYQDHYAKGRSPLKGDIVESEAKIVRVKHTSRN